MIKRIQLYKVASLCLIGILFLCEGVFGEVVGFENKTDTTFVVFYEDINDENIDLIGSYDVAVIEPSGDK